MSSLPNRPDADREVYMSTDTKFISEECTAVAFYGIDPNATAAAEFYHFAVTWFSKLGYPPDKVSVHGPGHGGKYGSFVRENTKLQRQGYEGISGYSLVSNMPNALTWGRDYYVTANYDNRSESSFASVVVRSSLVAPLPGGLLPIARKMVETLKPAYGIGYIRDHRYGPELYAIGINHSGGVVLTGDAYEEARSVSRWCDLGMVQQVYRNGLQRDVYPWNFLTKPQLSRPVNDVPLEQWVYQEAGRGKITSFCEGISLWEVGLADLAKVRTALRHAGAVFDWRAYS